MESPTYFAEREIVIAANRLLRSRDVLLNLNVGHDLLSPSFPMDRRVHGMHIAVNRKCVPRAHYFWTKKNPQESAG
jgi:hypothetical protein